jgi:hypothetical protein
MTRWRGFFFVWRYCFDSVFLEKFIKAFPVGSRWSHGFKPVRRDQHWLVVQEATLFEYRQDGVNECPCSDAVVLTP